MHTVIALLLLAASPDAAGTATSAPPPAEAKPEKPKKICKTINMTGSRVGRRECRTIEQWTQAESASELTVKGNAGNPSPQCAMCGQNPGPN